MKKYLTLLCFILLSVTLFAKPTLLVKKIANLPAVLKETSGLVYTHHRLWTLVDSHFISLFELAPSNGHLLKTVKIARAHNRDWEALAQDTHYFYIADIGNNAGARKNLVIYRVKKSRVLRARNHARVQSRKIYFHYPEQTVFHSRAYQHNFDAEALLAYKHHLLLWTKNWGNKRTVLYRLPKTPGRYAAKKIAEFNAKGLITDATQAHGTLYLLGYRLHVLALRPFVLIVPEFMRHAKTHITRLSLPIHRQAEGIAAVKHGAWYMTAEAGLRQRATLYFVVKR
jgi:hypothetical protein